MRRASAVTVTASLALVLIGGGMAAANPTTVAELIARPSGWETACDYAKRRPATCSPELPTSSAAWPTGIDPENLEYGQNKRVVVLGDSFTSGEGAPEILSVQEAAPPGTREFWRGGYWGTRDSWVDGTDEPYNRCHQSKAAYGFLFAANNNLRLDRDDFRACSGAVSDDYLDPQGSRFIQGQRAIDRYTSRWFLARAGINIGDDIRIPRQRDPQIPSDTGVVLVGFGGNDVEFAPVVMACISSGFYEAAGRTSNDVIKLLTQAFIGDFPGAEGQEEPIFEEQTVQGWGDCSDDVEMRTSSLSEYLRVPAFPGAPDPDAIRGVDAVYGAVRAAAPTDARIIATSYPLLFPDEPAQACDLGTGVGKILSIEEQLAINEFVRALNGILRTQATAAGIEFVDMRYAFRTNNEAQGSDHGLCVDKAGDESGRYINRFQLGLPSRVNSDNPDASFGSLASSVVPDTSESVHPNRFGHRAMLRVVQACYTEPSNCSNYRDLELADSLTATASEVLENYDWWARALADAECGDEAFWRARIESHANKDDAVEDIDFLAWWNAQAPKKTRGDITGDGIAEMFVQLACPSDTSPNSPELFVYNVAGANPELIADLSGDELAWGEDTRITNLITTISFDGPVAATGQANSDDEALWGHIEYRWSGTAYVLAASSFVARSSGATPSLGGLPQGTEPNSSTVNGSDVPEATDLPADARAGVITDTDQATRSLSIDYIQWFDASTSPTAFDACTRDGISIGYDAVCNEYYVRNADPSVRNVRVASSFTAAPWSESASQGSPLTWDEFIAEVDLAPDGYWLFTYNTENEVTSAIEQYTP